MTHLDQLVIEAVEARKALDALPPRRLSGPAFLARAMSYADADDADLDRLEKHLNNCPEVAAFSRRVQRLITDGLVPEPFPAREHAKVVGAYGTPGVRAELSGRKLGSSIGIALALAARQLAAKNPKAFGQVDDLAAYDREAACHRDSLDSALGVMPRAISGLDTEFDQTTLSHAQRDAGLAIVRFKRWPYVLLAPDWPARLVEAELAKQDAAAQKKAEAKVEAAKSKKLRRHRLARGRVEATAEGAVA